MNIYKINDYRDLISSRLEVKLGKGCRVKLATALSCHPGYVSQVLNKSKIHFSLENIITISKFLELTPNEEDYFLCLHQYERAGTVDLRKYWKSKINKVQEENLKVEKQIKEISMELDEPTKATYYSHWAYSAIHMLVSLQKFQTSQEIANRLHINDKLAKKVLSFLIKNEMIIKTEKGYNIHKTRIHLTSHSPLVKTHHQNFRFRAIQSLEDENDFDLHYSAVLTMSKKDTIVIREMILEFLSSKEKVLLPSKDEELVFLNIDYFK